MTAVLDAVAPVREQYRRRTKAERVADTGGGLFYARNVRADVAYQTRPLHWMVDRLGVPEHTIRWSLNPGYDRHTWDGTPDPHVAVLDALAAGKSAAVESATGTQKTYMAACIALWFVDCFPDALVVTSAPKEKQLTLHLWKEIGRLWPRYLLHRPSAGLTQLRVQMRPDAPGADAWAIHGFAAGVGASEESATKAQGFHAEHMLIITEERPGMASAVTTAFANTATAPHNLELGLGNPDHLLDELHLMTQRPNTVAVRISALDHPNVVSRNPAIVPGAVSQASIDTRAHTYGADSRLYNSRVRGICPAEAADSLIRLEWIDAAQKRGWALAEIDGAPALGVDVANSENGDKAAKARGCGPVLLELTAFACPDANQLGRDVWADDVVRDGIAPDRVGVDTVGVGAGTYNELRREALAAAAGPADAVLPVSLNGGAGAWEITGQEEEFNNLRSQMYWQLRHDLQHGHAAFRLSPEAFARLRRQATQPTYTTRGGVIVVESKETIKTRLGSKSPDELDAVVYWNWVRVQRRATPKLAKPSPDPRRFLVVH